jgi:hypothetical protein
MAGDSAAVAAVLIEHGADVNALDEQVYLGCRSWHLSLILTTNITATALLRSRDMTVETAFVLIGPLAQAVCMYVSMCHIADARWDCGEVAVMYMRTAWSHFQR